MKLQSDITAMIHLYRTEEGGRKSPLPPHQFNCLFEYEGENFDCRLLLDEVGSVQLGDDKVVPIKFLNWHLIAKRLKPGVQFHLREMREIANGEVKEMCQVNQVNEAQRA